MRKHSLWIPVGFITFLLGVLAFYLFWFSPWQQMAKIDAVPTVANSECADSKSFPGLSREISSLKKGKSGYFPKSAFSGNLIDDNASIDEDYGQYLRSMGEASLFDEPDKEVEKYRFLWLRSFHHPIYIRVENGPNGMRLSTKELGGAGGFDPGKIIRSQELSLNHGEWCEFLGRLEKANFWSLPTNRGDLVGVDGAEWILEGSKANRYHAVDRWSPNTGEYREACIYLLRLSGVDVDKLGDDLY